MELPEIPKDIMATAIRSLMVAEHDMVESVARALLERDRAATERAAKIADGWPLRDDLDEGDIWSVSMNIAAAIRSQP